MLANIVSVNVNLRQVCTKQLLCLTSRFESVCVCVHVCVRVSVQCTKHSLLSSSQVYKEALNQ